MIKYIVESATYAKNNKKQYVLYDQVYVFVQNPLPSEVSVDNVLKKVKEFIPKHTIRDLETIYVGDFKPLNDRQVDSMYVDGSIMVSNKHESDKAFFNTLIHEIAHATEDCNKEKIYGDGDLAREFLAKRTVLYNLLKDDYKLNKNDFLNIEFNKSFDDFAHKTIGYDNLGIITSGMFMSPYGCTSLREYFANCFEHYFIDGPQAVAKIAPIAYKKIKLVLSKKQF